MNNRPIIIEGLRGAGKTPLIASLREYLISDGSGVTTFRPFTLAENISLSWHGMTFEDLLIEGDSGKCIPVIQHMVDEVCDIPTQLPNLYNDGIVIFDRHWFSIMMACSMIPESRSFALECSHRLVKTNPVTFFIAAPKEVLRNRNSRNAKMPGYDEDVDDFYRLRSYEQMRDIYFDGIFWVNSGRISMKNLARDVISSYKDVVNPPKTGIVRFCWKKIRENRERRWSGEYEKNKKVLDKIR